MAEIEAFQQSLLKLLCITTSADVVYSMAAVSGPCSECRSHVSPAERLRTALSGEPTCWASNIPRYSGKKLGKPFVFSGSLRCIFTRERQYLLVPLITLLLQRAVWRSLPIYTIIPIATLSAPTSIYITACKSPKTQLGLSQKIPAVLTKSYVRSPAFHSPYAGVAKILCSRTASDLILS